MKPIVAPQPDPTTPLERSPRLAGLLTVWRRLRRHRLAVAGLIVLIGLVCVALLADVLAPYAPDQGRLLDALKPSSAEHLLGTDNLGRDVLSRIIYGTRYSLGVGLISVALGLLVGVGLGALAGYAGGWVDTLIGRFIDVLLAFPATLLAVGIVVMLGPGLEKAMIAVGIVSVPQYARLVRGVVLSAKQNEYVEAARALGGSHRRIMFRHILPNVFAPILVRATMGTSEAILEAAALGFLGLGAQAPDPEWGLMLYEGQRYIYNAPHLVIWAGLAITLTVVSINLLGDGLRDALDPRLKR